MSAPRDIVEALLSRLDPDEHDRPVELLKEGPGVVERLGFGRSHRSTLHRLAASGRLRVLRVGRVRYVTARLLAEHFAEAGQEAPRKPRKRRTRAGAGR